MWGFKTLKQTHFSQEIGCNIFSQVMVICLTSWDFDIYYLKFKAKSVQEYYILTIWNRILKTLKFETSFRYLQSHYVIGLDQSASAQLAVIWIIIRIRCVKSVRSISPYSARMRENKDQNNFEYGHFSRSDSTTTTQA